MDLYFYSKKLTKFKYDLNHVNDRIKDVKLINISLLCIA